MGKVRPVIQNNEWQMTKHEFYSAYHFALQYNEWKDMIDAIASIDSPDPDMAGMPRGSGINDSTFMKAVKVSQYKDRMRMVEETAKKVGPDIYMWLLKGVTTDGCTYNYLHMRMGIPCGKNYYYKKRREFYYYLNQRMINDEK